MAEKKNLLDPGSIAGIIRACSDAQVAVLKYGDLYLRFARHSDPTQDVGPKAFSLGSEIAPAPLSPASATEIAGIQKHESERALVQDELSARDDQLALMLIEDPVEHERMVISGELDDGGDSTDTEET